MFLINPQSKLPLYEQLTRQLRQQIVLGLVEADAPLPSVRQLSTELGVNPNTVQKAYRQMEQEGLIVSLPGRGSFVTKEIGRMQERQRAAELEALEGALRQCRQIGVSKTAVAALTEKVYKEGSSC